MKKLPIGIQSFDRLRSENYLYVDKTEYIFQLVSQGRQYFLSRPRRFGKSLLLSAMRAYFEGRKELFHGLKIEKLLEDTPDAWEPHPVFYFDFNGKNYQSENALENVLDEMLRRWEAIYGDSGGKSLEERFRKLLEAAYEQTGRHCVVLVDEYDKPLLESLENNSMEEHNKAVFKGFFGTLKSYDDYLHFVFITGVTRFSKVSIFSDLNQLEDISLDNSYASICGITEGELREVFSEELQQFAQECAMSVGEAIDVLRRAYDGYHFTSDIGSGIYNPFSLLCALKKKKTGYYWFETGTPAFLIRRLRQNGFNPRKFTDRTLYANDAMLSDYRVDNPDLIPLLYQTGYLTIVDYDSRRRRYTLSFPNEEVAYGFLEGLATEYIPNGGRSDGTDIFALDEYIENGDLESLKNALIAIFAKIPYTIQDAPFEHYFQTVIYLVFTLLKQFVQCETHTFQGRVDCIVETRNYVYIFEFKRDDSADSALTQIDSMGYALPYAADGRVLFKVGVAFDSATRMLSEWKALRR